MSPESDYLVKRSDPFDTPGRLKDVADVESVLVQIQVTGTDGDEASFCRVSLIHPSVNLSYVFPRPIFLDASGWSLFNYARQRRISL